MFFSIFLSEKCVCVWHWNLCRWLLYIQNYISLVFQLTVHDPTSSTLLVVEFWFKIQNRFGSSLRWMSNSKQSHFDMIFVLAYVWFYDLSSLSYKIVLIFGSVWGQKYDSSQTWYMAGLCQVRPVLSLMYTTNTCCLLAFWCT